MDEEEHEYGEEFIKDLAADLGWDFDNLNDMVEEVIDSLEIELELLEMGFKVARDKG